jgi:hypothetical protein
VDKGTVEFYAEIKFTTDAAYLVSDGAEEFWIPKSQIVEKEKISGHDYRFEIPEWLARDKGVI